MSVRHPDPQAPDHEPGRLDEDRRGLLALALTREAPPSPCPEPGEIAAWDAGTLPTSDAERVRKHVAHCDSCFTSWTGLREVQEEGREAHVASGGWASRLRERLAGLVAGRRTTGRGRRRRAWTTPAYGAAAALSIAVVGVVLYPRGDMAPPPATLGYSYVLGGEQAMRGDEEPSTRVSFVQGTGFAVTFRPEDRIPGPVTARIYVADDAGVRRLEAPEARASDTGAMRIDGVVGTNVRLPPGNSVLLMVVGRPAALPDGEELLRRLKARDSLHTPDWSAWRVRVHYGPS